MKVTGQITVNTPQGQMTLQGDDLTQTDYIEGNEIELSHDTGEWAVSKVFGGEPGARDGDWEAENCSVVSENISIDYLEE